MSTDNPKPIRVVNPRPERLSSMVMLAQLFGAKEVRYSYSPPGEMYHFVRGDEEFRICIHRSREDDDNMAILGDIEILTDKVGWISCSRLLGHVNKDASPQVICTIPPLEIVNDTK
jgi:hypothetical protein